ncbi:TonB-dependent receptor plug domain-containing protein, partial [Parabacteroides sp.]
MRKLIYIVTIICLSIPGLLLAQQTEMDNRQQFALAESEYQVGHIDSAIDMLNQHINTYSGTLKVSAYRLLALCSLAQDDLTNANKYVDLLLKEDPYYSISINDSERFAELIRNKKEGKTTLVTASQQAETLEEAPVPVTLITEEMIKAIGARNLRDVLLAYVPGMSLIENTNEMNVAMRGVYTSGQQKILIMIDGHRLNSYSTNTAAPDFSIGLNKIKQIEVLRGPASSLYGNVALTGVINIITKSGLDVEGVKATIGVGNYGQYKADFLFGKRFMNTDFIGWGSYYQASGEKVFESKADGYGLLPLDGNVILQGFNGKPSFDLGFKYQWMNFYAFYNYQHAKMIPTYSTSVFCAPYTYNAYRSIDGVKPGHSRFSHRGEIGYKNSWNQISLKISAYIDAEENNNYDIVGDTIYPIVSIPITATKDTVYPTIGCFQSLNWQDYLYGVSSNLGFNYKSKNNEGSILIGAQFENYNLYDSYMIVGNKFEEILSTYSKEDEQIKAGNELSISSFAQIKNKFYNHFIINAGLRYDHKRRLNHKSIQALSPRISLIFFKPNWDMKLNYSKSFVDAPYFNRNNILAIYKGAENLSPEYMESIQYSFSHKMNNLGLLYEGNFYYNNLTNIIYNTPNSDLAYINAGYLKSLGLELVLHYNLKNFKADFNLTWQYLLDAENYSTTRDKINSIPSFTSNIILTQKILCAKQHTFWIHAHGNIISKQVTTTSSFAATPPIYKEEESPARLLLNLGIDYNWKNLELSLNAYNISNT